jgi:threonylcarbamoyladenosine tRNA methylthiotransferase MtaB
MPGNCYFRRMDFRPTFSVYTLGCKLNFAESSTLGRQLSEAGFEKTEFENGADVVVINTCSVTDNADKECRSIVRKALSKNPNSFVAVTGCYAQLKPQDIASIDGVDIILGAKEKFNLANLISDFSKRSHTEVHCCEIGNANTFNTAFSFGDRTRAFLKVQDGCDYSCTYCTIPLARGNSRSGTIKQVLESVREISEKGIREIVLTGVNIGDFGITSGDKKHATTFFDLLKSLEEVKNIERFRISSIEPNLLTTEMIEFVSASEKFAQHFHMPLQSGSDKILALMRRRYKRQVYTDRVELIRKLLPHACIGADVITGFPGETEKDFLDTYNYLNQLDISYLHVFTYSERDNTAAAEMKEVVPMGERKRRNKMLRILSEKKRHAFYQSNIDRCEKVIFEEQNNNGLMGGYTGNYIRVQMPYDAALINVPAEIKIMDFSGPEVMNAIRTKSISMQTENILVNPTACIQA